TVEGHAAEGGARGRAGARPERDHPGRAAHRARRRLRPPGQGRAARARQERRHGDHDHAHSRGRRAHGRPHRRDRRRTTDRARPARGAARPGRPWRRQPRGYLPGARRRAGCGVTHPGTLVWFARHESRLAWRDWLAMMTAGGRWRTRSVAIVCTIVLVAMHLLALSVVGRFASLVEPDRTALVIMTGCALLAWSLMP